MSYSQFTLPGRPLLSTPAWGLHWLFWALFGNADDGQIGDLNWNPAQENNWRRRLAWWIRNPAHNLTFYVLGAADLDQIRAGRYPLSVFAPDGGFNWAISHTRRDSLRFRLDLVWLAAWLLSLLLSPADGAWLISLPMVAFYLLRSFRSYGWMPFVSWQSPRVKAYIGWRERGNFGIKLNLKRAQ